jgi:hypothetical protein
VTPAIPVSLPLLASGGFLLVAGVALGAVIGWLTKPERVQGEVEMHINEEEPDPDVAIALADWISENSWEARDTGGILN